MSIQIRGPYRDVTDELYYMIITIDRHLYHLKGFYGDKDVLKAADILTVDPANFNALKEFTLSMLKSMPEGYSIEIPPQIEQILNLNPGPVITYHKDQFGKPYAKADFTNVPPIKPDPA